MARALSDVAAAAVAIIGAVAAYLATRSGGAKPLAGELGHATLTRAMQDIDIREQGKNDGPRVRQYLRQVGLGPGHPWCAAAVATWLHEAADVLGRPPPIEGSASSLTTREQLKTAGLWRPIATVRHSHVEPGSIIIWRRPKQGAWRGHIGLVRSWDAGGGTVTHISGNTGVAGDRVAVATTTLDDPNLLGIGVLV